MMNRQQRRAMSAPVSENQRVQLSIIGEHVELKMTGMTSKVSTHAMLISKDAFKLGWALLKGSFKTWWKKS